MNAPVLLVLLLGLIGAGGYANYQRNAELDQELEFRPYAGLSDADLDALLEAYQQELSQIEDSLGNGPDGSVFRGIKPADLGGKLKAFERFQQENERWKRGHREAIKQKVVLDALRQEQAVRRAGLHRPWRRIIRRVTTF